MIAGWLLTRTRAMPAEAATAISGARSKVPVLQQQRALAAVAAAAVHVVVGRRYDRRLQRRETICHFDTARRGMTQSLASGRMAPVITSMASSLRTSLSAGEPARLSRLDAKAAHARGAATRCRPRCRPCVTRSKGG